MDRSRRAVSFWRSSLGDLAEFDASLVAVPAPRSLGVGSLGVHPVVAVPPIRRSRGVVPVRPRVLPVLKSIVLPVLKSRPTVTLKQSVHCPPPLNINRSVSLGGGPQNFSLEVPVAGTFSVPGFLPLVLVSLCWPLALLSPWFLLPVPIQSSLRCLLRPHFAR